MTGVRLPGERMRARRDMGGRQEKGGEDPGQQGGEQRPDFLSVRGTLNAKIDGHLEK